jgi:hypothetical protein
MAEAPFFIPQYLDAQFQVVDSAFEILEQPQHKCTACPRIKTLGVYLDPLQAVSEITISAMYHMSGIKDAQKLIYQIPQLHITHQ